MVLEHRAALADDHHRDDVEADLEVRLVVCWARAIQLYVMAAFAPIPLSLMALDETRQMGVNYIKNFMSVCLAGIIILVLLVSFPIVLGGLNAASVGVPVIDSVVG